MAHVKLTIFGRCVIADAPHHSHLNDDWFYRRIGSIEGGGTRVIYGIGKEYMPHCDDAIRYAIDDFSNPHDTVEVDCHSERARRVFEIKGSLFADRVVKISDGKEEAEIADGSVV